MQFSWSHLHFHKAYGSVSVQSTCQRAKRVPISHFYVSTCQRAKSTPIIQLGVPTCQRCANFSTWRANVPNGVQFFISAYQRAVPVFRTFLFRNAKGNFYTLLLYKKFYIILDIIVIHIICICIVHKNCIMLHFYNLCHIKERYTEFLFFETFLVLQLKMKL